MFSFLKLPVLIRKLNYCNLHLFEHSINANIVHINLYSYSYIFRNNHPLRNIHRSCYSTFSDDPNQCPGSETAPQQQQSPLLIQHLPLFHLRWLFQWSESVSRLRNSNSRINSYRTLHLSGHSNGNCDRYWAMIKELSLRYCCMNYYQLYLHL